MSETAAHGCGGINKVIKIIKSLNGVHAKAEYFRECSTSHVKDLIRENVATQIAVIFDCLLKVSPMVVCSILSLKYCFLYYVNMQDRLNVIVIIVCLFLNFFLVKKKPKGTLPPCRLSFWC